MKKNLQCSLLSNRIGHPCLGLERSFFVAENSTAIFMDIKPAMDYSAILEGNKNVIP